MRAAPHCRVSLSIPLENHRPNSYKHGRYWPRTLYWPMGRHDQFREGAPREPPLARKVSFMVIATLPRFLQHGKTGGLIRLGRDHDGGYVVSEADVLAADILITLGIADDWSFERDFAAKNDIPIIAYDGSVGTEIFVRTFFRTLYRHPAKPRRWMKDLKLILGFVRFFGGPGRSHVGKFVSLDNVGNHVAMEKVLSDTDSDRIFLKIDIEESEYMALEAILACQDRITALVIEFHECAARLDAIRDFVSRFSLPLVHIHANNWSPVDGESGLPLTMELTFSRSSVPGEEVAVYPCELDMPNNRDLPEIVLTFES